MIMEDSGYKLIFISLLIMLHANINECSDIGISTSVGRVVGYRMTIPELVKTVNVYLGVAYAEAPIANLRFKDPVPIGKDPHRILGKNQFAPSCPQPEIPIYRTFKGMRYFNITSIMDEDCLYLNIWKPTGGVASKPVIVWIHGGGYFGGGASVSLYDASILAGWTDAVVVTIQYRLGPLGFLYTGDDFAPGNAGLKDQALALKWVNEHIHNFGGNKDRITLAGESAGSASTGLHLLNPETSKLFKKGILLSGVPINHWSFKQPSEAKYITLSLAARLGANKSSYEDMKSYLMNISWREIVSKQLVIKHTILTLDYVPTIEPTLIPEDVHSMLKNANHLKGKEIIVEWTKDEGSFMVVLDLKIMNITQNPSDIPSINEKVYLERVLALVGEEKKTCIANLYRKNKDTYLNRIINLYSDIMFKCSIGQFIDEAKRHEAIVYQFEYDHRTKNNPWPEWMGTEHTADVEMFFGHPMYDKDNFNSEDVKLCEKFLNFIKEFVTNESTTSSDNVWFKKRTFVLGYGNKEIDQRKEICAKLNEPLSRPVFSGTNKLSIDIFGVLSFILFFKSLLN